MNNIAKEVEVVAERSNTKSLYLLNKVQLASLHYVEKLSRTNRKKISHREKNKKCHFPRTNSTSTTGHFNKEITFSKLNTKRVTSQSEDWKTYKQLKFAKVKAVAK